MTIPVRMRRVARASLLMKALLWILGVFRVPNVARNPTMPAAHPPALEQGEGLAEEMDRLSASRSVQQNTRFISCFIICARAQANFSLNTSSHASHMAAFPQTLTPGSVVQG